MRRSTTARRTSGAMLTAAALLMVVGCSELGLSSSEETERLGGPVPQATSTGDPDGETPSPSSSPGDVEATTDGSGEGEGHGPARDFTEVSVVEALATGLETPWDIDFLADGSALVTLRDSGQVLSLREGEVSQLDAGGPGGAVPDVHHETEDGLLGLTVGPDERIFVYLSTGEDNRVIRHDIDGESLIDPMVILEGIPRNSNHDGGRIAFGPDGYLYVSTGDALKTELAQDTDSLAGKILRITPDGDPAPGNPFGNEVWSYGHRNVQGLGWTSDGRMYASEFGSSEFDELNLIEPGNNYGWPHIEGWAGDPDYADPLVTWGTGEASPSGIAVTDAGVWMTALRGERLWYVPLDADGAVGEPRDYDLGLGRLRAVVTAPDGSLWVATSNTDGRGDPGADDDQILRLETS